MSFFKVSLLSITLLLPVLSVAGEITIEKKSSLIRNDIFDQKRQRAQEYQAREKLRKEYNQHWSYRLPPECGLLPQYYLIYLCANGRYFKGYDVPSGLQYRQLHPDEVKQLDEAGQTSSAQ